MFQESVVFDGASSAEPIRDCAKNDDNEMRTLKGGKKIICATVTSLNIIHANPLSNSHMILRIAKAH